MPRILILTTTFFPHPVVAGVRMTQWARHLPEFGWRPIVASRHYGHTATRAMLDEHVHPEVEVHYLDQAKEGRGPGRGERRSGNAPGARWKNQITRSWVGSAFVPDPSIRFWRSIRPKLLEIVEQVQPDVLLTTSPPHSNHDPGIWLADRVGLPWIADFRDPFTIDPRFQPGGPGRLLGPKRRAYEAAIYRRAAAILHAIPVHARWARRVYPFARNRIHTLTNGFPEELAAGQVAGEPTAGSRRSLRVIGHISAEAAAQLASAIERLAEQGTDLELRLIGAPPENEPALQDQLGERLKVLGSLAHNQALAQVAGADVLVSYASRERSQALLLSSKLFEYAATDKPILCINPTRPDRRLLRRMPGTHMLERPNLDQVVDAIRTTLDSASGAQSLAAERQKPQFNRRDQAGMLAAWLDGLVERSGRLEDSH